ncbi:MULTISPECIES: DUF1367 family protein [Serratia]
MIFLNSRRFNPARAEISFAKMDNLEFNDLYQAALNALWIFILNKSFLTIAEA